jgi:hypothetical protein
VEDMAGPAETTNIAPKSPWLRSHSTHDHIPVPFIGVSSIIHEVQTHNETNTMFSCLVYFFFFFFSPTCLPEIQIPAYLVGT